MDLDTEKSTRREFLKKSAGVVGTAILAGCAAERMGPRETDARSSMGTPTTTKGRHHYRAFSEGRIGGLRIKNRLVRSATMINAASDGNPTETYIEKFRDLAAGGVGLIITGHMLPVRNDVLNPRQIHVYDDRHIEGLRRVADAVKGVDSRCKLFAQIGHSGEGVSPSGIKWPWKREGRALTTQEVEAIVGESADAVGRIKQSGFDGVELHGAHGFLLSAFLSPYTNRRADKYGGSVEGRVRIVRDIVEQARRRVGSAFPILIKVNSDDNVEGGTRPEAFPQTAREIERTGVDALHISGNDAAKKDIDTVEEETYFLESARAAKLSIPTIVTGGNRSIDHLEELLQRNGVDFFGLARPLIREPDLPNRWLEARGDTSAKCISCNGCFGPIGRGEPVYCIQEE